MNDERLGQEIGDFYRETDVTSPDSTESARQVATRLARTPQVKRHRWPPAWLQRSTVTEPTETTIEPDPEVTGRTRSMLSPASALTAGALAFAIGGVLLIAQPFQQEGLAPGAEAPPVEPTWVTGTATWAPSCSGPESVEVDGDVTREIGYVCEPTSIEASDPRLTVEGSWRWNADLYDTAEGRRTVVNGAEYLRNDDGGWTCPITRLANTSGVNPNQYGQARSSSALATAATRGCQPSSSGATTT